MFRVLLGVRLSDRFAHLVAEQPREGDATGDQAIIETKRAFKISRGGAGTSAVIHAPIDGAEVIM